MWMNCPLTKIGVRLAVIAVALFAALPGRAASPEADYSGHYEMVNAKAGRVFSLDVKQNHERVDVSFSAAMEDGSGAAPDATGQGRIENGVLSFDFKDSFNNEGSCTLALGTGGYHLCMMVAKIVDPSPLHFYGNVLLKKTSTKSH